MQRYAELPGHLDFVVLFYSVGVFPGEKNGSCWKSQLSTRYWFCLTRRVLITGVATSDSSGGHAAGGGEVADLQRSPSGGNRKTVHKAGQHGQILRC